MTFSVEPIEVYRVAGGPFVYKRWVQIGGEWHYLESGGDVHLDGVALIDVAEFHKELNVANTQ